MVLVLLPLYSPFLQGGGAVGVGRWIPPPPHTHP